jgi:hypothetical protein
MRAVCFLLKIKYYLNDKVASAYNTHTLVGDTYDLLVVHAASLALDGQNLPSIMSLESSQRLFL